MKKNRIGLSLRINGLIRTILELELKQTRSNYFTVNHIEDYEFLKFLTQKALQQPSLYFSIDQYDKILEVASDYGVSLCMIEK